VLKLPVTANVASVSLILSTLLMEAVSSSETLVPTIIMRHEDGILDYTAFGQYPQAEFCVHGN
jgi:hypothetical protein